MGFVDDVVMGIADYVGDQISEALSTFFGKVLYYLTIAFVYILKIVYEFFAVFSGSKRVRYDGAKNYLINIFFGNDSINNVYWGMALIGMLFAIVFAFIAVLRKSFDLGDNHQRSMGGIIMNIGKSMLAILLLSSVMTAMLNITNVLVDRVNYIFDYADSFDKKTEMTFNDEQYAAMARIYNTIGNYSLNSSRNSRFNLNSCYNAIRGDLLYLQEEGVFDFYYEDKDINGNPSPTWQSELQKILNEHDPRTDIKLDDSETVSSILDVMKILETNNAFYPVSHIKRTVSTTSENISLDRIIFLIGTLNAAKDSYFNSDPELTDALRSPFFYGDKSIYSLEDVQNSFNIMLDGISYVVILLMTILTLKNLAVCIFNCIARIFNLLSLYIVAPPIFATMPLDDGAKFKQWVQAAVIQLFGIFGSIIPMRLVIMFVPMILDSKLELFESITMNILGKAVLIVGAVEAANRFSQVFTGILAGSSGAAAIRSSDMSGLGAKVFGGAASVIGGAALGTAGAAVNLSGLGTVGRFAASAVGKGADTASDYVNNKGGIIGAAVFGMRDAVRHFTRPTPPKDGDSDGKGKDGNKPLPDNLHKKK